ncbi:MAG: hypothetical protein J7K35_06965, partial [Syntrophobacterales bacterium]|nr:hypothetical protein [Syntrophobacterales bacterium]
RKKSQKHSFVILSDSEESDIIEILCRSAPQNDTAWTFYECVNNGAFVKSPKTVIPDLIRYPEVVEFTGFRLSSE